MPIELFYSGAATKIIMVDGSEKKIFNNYSELQFIKEKDSLTLNLLKDKNKVIDSLKSNISKYLNRSKKIDSIYLVPIGLIYNFKNAYAEIQIDYEYHNSLQSIRLWTINYTIIKNKKITTFIICDFKGIESIKWITETSESWAKAIIEANK